MEQQLRHFLYTHTAFSFSYHPHTPITNSLLPTFIIRYYRILKPELCCIWAEIKPKLFDCSAVIVHFWNNTLQIEIE